MLIKTFIKELKTEDNNFELSSLDLDFREVVNMSTSTFESEGKQLIAITSLLKD